MTGIALSTFTNPLTNQNLFTWPHLPVREAGESRLYFGSHIPSNEPEDVTIDRVNDTGTPSGL